MKHPLILGNRSLPRASLREKEASSKRRGAPFTVLLGAVTRERPETPLPFMLGLSRLERTPCALPDLCVHVDCSLA
ncbi:MAG: hypothetical protein MZV70_63555 [Desulfobacterales bacterium]|nr:hypothetical protein [Desulfobacterales bacterium]